MPAAAAPVAGAALDGAARVRVVGAVSADFTVRSATQLQLGPTLTARAARHEAYVSSALGEPQGGAPAGAAAGAVAAGVQQLRRSLKAAWRIPWENTQKITLWRLAVGGVPAAGGHGICPRRPCLCGWQPAPGLPQAAQAAQLQRHVFWAEDGDAAACPVAAAVLRQLRQALPPPAGAALSCADLWLLRPPVGGRVHAGVWGVVGMAALSAMQHGRRCAWAYHKLAQEARDPAGLRQARLDEFPGFALQRGVPGPGAEMAAAPAPPVQPITRAGRRAAADFWGRLSDFAELDGAPESWMVAPDAPFLAGAGGARLVVHLPEGGA